MKNIKVGTSSYNMKIPEKHPRKKMANIPFTPGEPSPTSPNKGMPTPTKKQKKRKRTPVQQGHRRRQWHPTPVLLPGKSHGWRSLVGYSPWGRYESDTTERLHFNFSLSCIGEGNSNPLQGSCLENPRDGGAWWAAVYGVAQSWTRLKRLSSSSKTGT